MRPSGVGSGGQVPRPLPACTVLDLKTSSPDSVTVWLPQLYVGEVPCSLWCPGFSLCVRLRLHGIC